MGHLQIEGAYSYTEWLEIQHPNDAIPDVCIAIRRAWIMQSYAPLFRHNVHVGSAVILPIPSDQPTLAPANLPARENIKDALTGQPS